MKGNEREEAGAGAALKSTERRKGFKHPRVLDKKLLPANQSVPQKGAAVDIEALKQLRKVQ
jgi:hypothetical protein